MVPLQKDYLQVSEIMTKNPVCIQTGEKVTAVAQKMRSYNINSLLVLKGKKLIGIVTSDDVVKKFVAKNRDADSTTVSDIMSKDLVVAEPTIDIREAMDLLNDNDIKQLPILYKNTLAGLVTLKDVLRIEPALMDLAVDRIREEERVRQNMIQQYAEDDFLQPEEDEEDEEELN